MSTINREIVVENLVKRYGSFTAVDGISFKVEDGEIFGFLGPNGAGKSTTVQMLTTLAVPTEGRATVGGFDIATQASDVRSVAGVALQEIGLDPIMKSLELLSIQGRLFGMSHRDSMKRAHELLELVKLTEFADRRVGKYSGGMRRRLDLALALVHRPEVLFLDEPTTGLDPASRRDIWTEVKRLNRENNMTIFLTTQYLEEADELADRIAIINKGTIVTEGQPAALKAALGRESINIVLKDTDSAESAASRLGDMFDRIQVDRRTVRLYRANAAEAVPTVVNRLTDATIEVVSLTLTQPTLDDVFLKATGERFENETEAVSK